MLRKTSLYSVVRRVHPTKATVVSQRMHSPFPLSFWPLLHFLPLENFLPLSPGLTDPLSAPPLRARPWAGGLGKLPPAVLVRDWGWAWGVLLEGGLSLGAGGTRPPGRCRVRSCSGVSSYPGSCRAWGRSLRAFLCPCPYPHDTPGTQTLQGAPCTCVHAQNLKLMPTAKTL